MRVQEVFVLLYARYGSFPKPQTHSCSWARLSIIICNDLKGKVCQFGKYTFLSYMLRRYCDGWCHQSIVLLTVEGNLCLMILFKSKKKYNNYIIYHFCSSSRGLSPHHAVGAWWWGVVTSESWRGEQRSSWWQSERDWEKLQFCIL